MQPCTRASVRTDARASPWASSASSRGVLHADDLEAPGRELWREAGLGMCVEDLLQRREVPAVDLLDPLVARLKVLRPNLHRLAPPHVDVGGQRQEPRHGQTEAGGDDGQAEARAPVDPLADAVHALHAPEHLGLVEDVAGQEVVDAMSDGLPDEAELGGEDHLLLVVPRHQLLPHAAGLYGDACATRQEVFHDLFVHPPAVHEHQRLPDDGQAEQRRCHHGEPLPAGGLAEDGLLAQEKQSAPGKEAVGVPHDHVSLRRVQAVHVLAALGGQPHSDEMRESSEGRLRQHTQPSWSHAAGARLCARQHLSAGQRVRGVQRCGRGRRAGPLERHRAGKPAAWESAERRACKENV
mmetsp:Transcript_63317/g.200004  ORF Transcript_63317/g.200004 Transcript_63317/m.200004 type:complete len:353 (+) Transcript_63317:186-1244(+)